MKKEIGFLLIVIGSSLAGYFAPNLTAEKTMLWSLAASLSLFYVYQLIKIKAINPKNLIRDLGIPFLLMYLALVEHIGLYVWHPEAPQEPSFMVDNFLSFCIIVGFYTFKEKVLK